MYVCSITFIGSVLVQQWYGISALIRVSYKVSILVKLFLSIKLDPFLIIVLVKSIITFHLLKKCKKRSLELFQANMLKYFFIILQI